MLINKNRLLSSLLILLAVCPLAEASVSSGTANQIEQDKARYSALTPQEQEHSSTRENSRPGIINFPNEAICKNISKIIIESDDEKLTNRLLGKITRQGVNKCLGIKGIRLLSNTMQNELLVKGYITSLINVPQQSLEGGVLHLILTYGTIGKIAFQPGQKRRRHSGTLCLSLPAIPCAYPIWSKAWPTCNVFQVPQPICSLFRGSTTRKPTFL